MEAFSNRLLTEYLILIYFLDFLEEFALIGHNHLFYSGGVVDFLFERSEDHEQVFDDGDGRLRQYVLP